MQYKTKKEAIEAFVERDFKPIPQEWVKIVAEAKGEEIYSWPMWGTMWFVNFAIWGEKLMKHSQLVVHPEECENHDKHETCYLCEDGEEMAGAHNFVYENEHGTQSTAIYVYEVDGRYLIGVHGAGWDFYDGVWDRLYDFFDLKWHDTKCTHFQCNKEAVKNTDACEDHTFCNCEKVGGKYHAHYLPDCPNKKKGELK